MFATQRPMKSLQPIHFTTLFLLLLLFLNAYYFNSYVHNSRNILGSGNQASIQTPFQPSQSQLAVPNLFIYRRTKKTGSSAMLDALMAALGPYGYIPTYAGGPEAAIVVRSERFRPVPRRLLVAKHNQITRDYDPERRAVIADTFRDGYVQMTSFCRWVKGIKECDDQIIECLQSANTLTENTYRWAYRKEEDADTYIDLPLSSAHPALSMTILRTVFPNATLNVHSYNVANSSCPEIPALREVYDKLYQPLERQIEALRRRMLVLAGYPWEVDRKLEGRISLAEMIDEAESKEKVKYDLRKRNDATSAYSTSHKKLIEERMVWTRTDTNSIDIKPRFG